MGITLSSHPPVVPPPQQRPPPRAGPRSRVRQVVLIAMAILVSIVAVELVMQAALRVRAGYFSKSDRYLALIGSAGRQQIYPGWSGRELRQLLHETYVPVTYEAFTGFAERPRTGRFVNVSGGGYRQGSSPQPWPPDPAAINVFVFGGSTTFGYGVADAQTIPAAMQDSLAGAFCSHRIEIYNFGRGFYYSSQERALFQRLLTAGYRPSAAVFIDGLNDSDNDRDVLPFADDFARLFSVRQGDAGWLGSLAVLTATGRVVRRLIDDNGPQNSDVRSATVETGQQAAARWIENVRLTAATARATAVLPLFVVQPVRAYRFDFTAHPLADQAARDKSVPVVQTFYEALEQRRSADPVFDDVLWLAEAHTGVPPARVFVDLGHYTAEFSARLAGRIASALRTRMPSGCVAPRT